ncbi:unnamed protein product, partial [Prorocentrum cordatum]
GVGDLGPEAPCLSSCPGAPALRDAARTVPRASVRTRCVSARHGFAHVSANASRQAHVCRRRVGLRANTLRAAGCVSGRPRAPSLEARGPALRKAEVGSLPRRVARRPPAAAPAPARRQGPLAAAGADQSTARRAAARLRGRPDGGTGGSPAGHGGPNAFLRGRPAGGAGGSPAGH